jgi:hypothetical protein
VQHVALHEGFIPGLGEMRNICGGSSSDIQIQIVKGTSRKYQTVIDG